MSPSEDLLKRLPNDIGGLPAEVIQRVEALGSEMIGKLSYYERWIAAFANILFQKGIVTPGELARKMEEVQSRS
jgi:hypothetical protein